MKRNDSVYRDVSGCAVWVRERYMLGYTMPSTYMVIERIMLQARHTTRDRTSRINTCMWFRRDRSIVGME